MKTALVTGASRGIGFETAVQLAEKGFRVFALWHSSPEKLKGCTNTNIVAVQGDVSDAASVADVHRQIGDIDLLVNNAAISMSGLITDLAQDDWNRMISVNLTSVFLCSKEFLPPMINRKTGRIINISSIFGTVGGSCEVAYSAAKAGVIGFTKALAKEVGPSGIFVNCIAPGVIATEMNSRLSESDMMALCDETPIGRIGTPADIARLVCFLAEDDFITGEVIHSGGGFLR